MTPVRGSRSILVAWTMVMAMLAALLLGPVPSAHASHGRLEFSTDGTTWTSAPPVALFERGVVLVPGRSASSTLHMRSTAETPGVLAAALTNVRVSDESVEKYFGVQASTGAGPGVDNGAGVGLPRTAVADLKEYTPVGSLLTLDPGQSTQFTLTIDLDLRPGGTGAQNSAIGLDLAISFTDATAVGGGDDGRPEGQDGIGGENGEGLNPPQVIPALPAPADQSPGTASAEAPSAAEPGTNAGPASDRGLLAITGIARSAIITALVSTLLGALLLAVSRSRREQS